MLTYIGQTFPHTWLWSRYERAIIANLQQQIYEHWPHGRHMFINLTWFGPQFNNTAWQQYQTHRGQNFDNLFLLSTVDPPMITADQIAQVQQDLGQPRLWTMGNFDSEFEFNFFAPVIAENFCTYRTEDLLMQDPEYLYINYNRKPRAHRVQLVRRLQKLGLDQLGVITLGRPNRIYDQDPSNDLYLSIGENPENYVQHGHWYSGPDEFGIPHDVLSLHRLDFWQQHFLHIVGATEFNHWDNIFVSETQFKPVLGLRPFVINGNARTYQWLRDRGFRTFESWFPGIDFDAVDHVHDSIIATVQQLAALTPTQLRSMYQDMLPTLYHNRQRFFEFAKEQQTKIQNLFQNHAL